ncbi:GMP synthase-Glutamine amidotransferase [Loktanella fryxellensis]|uniref:GMP synthase-Glutamine amidotransferase n=1 Tax=Loktanella fryxellensis TaxID=245187 RepID=A0A1H8ELH2_9RHOB|nr:type 1 glutamine amidotransferase [Loktanella fryxellensis]SEN19974.1 GMP synthase-Glutamine amidotransferase [Loktanella fryxellensis]
MHIGILQTGHAPDAMRPDTGDYADLFQRLLGGHDFDFTTWDVVDMQFPDGVHAAQGWLITGSKHGAYEDHPFIAPLETFIRDAYAAAVPMVGICFGHQIVAQALGGRVEKFAGGWAVGRQTYDWQGETVALNAWHQDQVVEAPEGAQVIASNAHCANAALVYGDRILTVQAHPEFDSAFTRRLGDTRGEGVVPPDLLTQARMTEHDPIDNALIADRMAQFLQAGARA